jgi:hypothetical protein
MTPSETNDGIDVLSTNAYLAVGVLADAIGPDTYHGRDVNEAIDHLRTGLEAGAKDTEAGRRIETALEYLADMEEYAPDKQRLKVRDALAELAPVAAGVTDRDRLAVEPYAPPEDKKPAVPVLYHVPRAAVDRAIRRFQHRRENNPTPERRTPLEEYIYEEIDERPVIYVGGEPLGEYASGRVESLVIEPDAEEDTDT